MVAALGGDGENTLDEAGVLRVAESGKREQRVHRSQPGIPGRHSHLALALEMIEEGADERSVEHLDLQFRRCDAGGLPREVEQQPKAVPIGGDRVRARMSLRTQPLDEEGFKGGREARS